MVDTIINFLSKYYPHIAGYALLVLVIVLVVYKCTKFYLKTKEVCDEFPSLKTLLQKIDKGFNTLNQILIEKNVISSSCYSEGNSPRKLNELGEKLFKDSGAEELFNKIKEELLTEFKKPNSFLELERNALKILFDKTNNPEFKGIQDFAYNHPNFEESPLTYTDILYIMSLKLRDAYIEKHPEIKL